MEIIYCSSDWICKNNCIYCFSKTKIYQKNKNFYDLKLDKKEYIIYPFCDDEIIIDTNFEKKLKEIINDSNYIILSFSTKNIINEKLIKKILDIDKLLKSKNKWFLKISITITTKSKIDEIEKWTCSFDNRLENLEILNKNQILNSVIIKPILPFLDISEYIEIVSETSKFTKNFMLWWLYFTKEMWIFDKYIKNNFSYKEKQLNWLEIKQKYYSIEQREKKKKLEECIRNIWGNYFDSDVDFLLEIKNKLWNDL